ncbi:hypothetical protein [Bdellovibrio sp. HCB337]|uniref:hypothetical protein n=1 Tax=Bdellovibrio sp. HCB337 TaxID=3394358 RepID=UPI0039A61C2A
MKAFLFIALFACSWAFAGGDVVNNGGGLSEQAIVFSARHYNSFIESCLRYDNCGAKAPVNAYLKRVQTCSLPKLNELYFATAQEEPALAPAKTYVLLANGHFVINRELLYSSSKEPLKVSGAFGYISRIYFDHCGVLEFSQTVDIAKSFASFAEADGEQVTIGKDNLYLPSQRWVRIRALYSDLIIEGPGSFLRLSCPSGQLNGCNLLDTQESNLASRFKNLTLSQESMTNGLLHFEVEGAFIGADRNRQYFKLTADYQDEKPVQITLQGQSLELPK